MRTAFLTVPMSSRNKLSLCDLSGGQRDDGMTDSLGTCGNAPNKWPRNGQANFSWTPRNRVLRGSRQSDSNRRPADYKSAALPTELCRHLRGKTFHSHSLFSAIVSPFCIPQTKAGTTCGFRSAAVAHCPHSLRRGKPIHQAGTLPTLIDAGWGGGLIR